MKILLLNQSFYPDQTATAQQLVDLSRFLIGLGHQVSVVCSQRAYEDAHKRFSAKENWEGIQIRRVQGTGLGKQSFVTRLIDGFTFELKLLWTLITFPKQDCIISFTSPPLVGVLGTWAARLRGSSSVQWLMDVNPDAAIAVGYLNPKKVWTRFLVWLFEGSIKNSHQVIVLDRWMQEKIQAHGVDAKKISIIPPWPVQEIPKEFEQGLGDAFRHTHDLVGKFIIMYSGNHSIVHPLDTLLNSALALKSRKDIAFVFIGGGLRAPEVKAFKEKHDLKNIVQLPFQPRENVRESLASADLHTVVMGDKVNGLVHTSKVYGVLATGRPYLFIGPERSHVADLIEACPYGFQAKNGDVQGVISIIEKVKAFTPKELSLYANENMKYLTQNCMPEHSLQEVEKLLAKLAVKPTTAPLSPDSYSNSGSQPEYPPRRPGRTDKQVLRRV